MNRHWVKNVQKTPKVKLAIGGKNFTGTARFLSDHAEHERAMAAIRRKYWVFRPIIEFGRMLSAIGSCEITLGHSRSHWVNSGVRLSIKFRG